MKFVNNVRVYNKTELVVLELVRQAKQYEADRRPVIGSTLGGLDWLEFVISQGNLAAMIKEIK